MNSGKIFQLLLLYEQSIIYSSSTLNLVYLFQFNPSILRAVTKTAVAASLARLKA